MKRTILGLVLGLAPLPLLWLFFRKYLWVQSQYQFFPLLLAGVAYLIWKRWPSGRRGPAQRGSRVETLLLMSGIAVLAAAVATWYPPLAGVAAILTTGGLLLYFAGRQYMRRLLPAWVLLWLIIPPPHPWDTVLIQKLQLATTWASSLILDVFGVLHLMEGTVLDFPGRRLFVEEACSGVQSLYAMLACTGLFLVWMRRPLLHALLLLMATVFWAGAGNIARVVTVALAQAWLGIDLSSGWVHELLGFVVFAIALGMLASTDAFLCFALAPVLDSPSKRNPNPFSRLWNRMVIGIRRPVTAHQTGRRRPWLAATGRFGWLLTTGAAGCLGALQLLMIVAIAVKAREQGIPRTETALVQQVAESLGPGFPPEGADGWRQVDYRREQREVNSIFGELSSAWQYECPSYQAVISVDYPFTGWHDLTVCYHNIGWQIVERREGAVAPWRGFYEEAELRKPTGEYGYLYFTLVDRAGRAATSKSIWYRLAPKFKGNPIWYLLGRDAIPMLDATTFQLQVFASSAENFSQEDRERMRGRFFKFRDRFRRTLEGLTRGSRAEGRRLERVGCAPSLELQIRQASGTGLFDDA